MRNRKAIALFAVLAIFAAACGGTAEEVVEEAPVVTEAPAITEAPATTAAPVETADP